MTAPVTYSFLDVNATLVGPGGVVNLGRGSAAADEGITIAMTEEKDVMTIGADGAGMHSLVASKAGKVTVRLLKTSPTNSALSAMYAVQTASSAAHGQNVLSISNPITGDSVTAVQGAFAKFPNNTYAKEGGMMEYEFNFVNIDQSLGGGIVANLVSFGAGIA